MSTQFEEEHVHFFIFRIKLSAQKKAYELQFDETKIIPLNQRGVEVVLNKEKDSNLIPVNLGPWDGRSSWLYLGKEYFWLNSEKKCMATGLAMYCYDQVKKKIKIQKQEYFLVRSGETWDCGLKCACVCGKKHCRDARWEGVLEQRGGWVAVMWARGLFFSCICFYYHFVFCTNVNTPPTQKLCLLK